MACFSTSNAYARVADLEQRLEKARFDAKLMVIEAEVALMMAQKEVVRLHQELQKDGY